MEKPSIRLSRLTSVTAQNNCIRKSLHLTKDVSLLYGRVHEVTGISGDSFAVNVCSRTKGVITWIGRERDVYSLCPTALMKFFDPERLVTIECLSRKEILWATEQALRSKGAECIISQVDQGPNLQESRRLQLAAEEGKSLGLVLISKQPRSSAAQTRWICAPTNPSKSANDNGWQWELTKNKSGLTGVWLAQPQLRQTNEPRNGGGYGTCYVHLVAVSSS